MRSKSVSAFPSSFTNPPVFSSQPLSPSTFMWSVGHRGFEISNLKLQIQKLRPLDSIQQLGERERGLGQLARDQRAVGVVVGRVQRQDPDFLWRAVGLESCGLDGYSDKSGFGAFGGVCGPKGGPLMVVALVLPILGVGRNRIGEDFQHV